MITLDSIELRRGVRPLLENASAVVHPGQKVALVGANGAGKSSLFQLLLGELPVDAGRVAVPGQWRIAHMAQEVATVERSALDFVLDGDGELRRLQDAIARAEANGDNHALARLHQAYDDADGYTAESRAQRLLQGLGFGADEANRPANSFSGGWRIRLNLAQALMCPSDLLLLDEPTNHLDLDATLWLEGWLQAYRGTVVLISHDRDFIDRVCDQVIHIEHRRLNSYKGNYSAFERQRAERLAQQQSDYEKQQARIAHIQDFVRRFRAKATKARQAQSRIKELERMEVLAPAHVDSVFDFEFPPPAKFSDPLLNLSHGTLGYSGASILNNVSLSLHPGTRIALLGANGAGKSTLIKSLAGELPLRAGERTCGEHLALGYFSQHQLEALDLDASPVLHLQRLTPSASEQSIRNFLGGFDFRGDMALAPIAPFSGGEKARLALAIVVWQKPNLLLLDEPTNHLDLEMRHALTVALQGFEGSVVLISHDRHLIRNTVDELLLVADGRVAPFDGDLDDYGRWLMAKNRETESAPPSQAQESQVRPADRKAQRRQAAEVRKQLAPLKKQLEQVEREMAKTQSRLDELEVALADNDLYQAQSRDRLAALLLDQGQLKTRLEDLEAQWLEQQEALEQLQAEIEAG